MLNKLSNDVYQISFKRFGSCVYLIKIGKDNIMIDTSSKDNSLELIQELKKIKVEPNDIHIILLTHSHYDHTGNLDLFPNAKVYSEKNINNLALILITVIKTPGHTMDSLCFLYKDILFSGDTLFINGIGRTDFPESNEKLMQESLNKLKKINYTILAPGHI